MRYEDADLSPFGGYDALTDGGGAPVRVICREEDDLGQTRMDERGVGPEPHSTRRALTESDPDR